MERRKLGFGVVGKGGLAEGNMAGLTAGRLEELGDPPLDLNTTPG